MLLTLRSYVERLYSWRDGITCIDYFMFPIKLGWLMSQDYKYNKKYVF